MASFGNKRTATPATPMTQSGFTNSRPYDSSKVDSGGLGSGGTGANSVDNDAFVAVKNQLDQYGLGSLAKFAYDALVQGKSEAEILRDIRETPEFKARFPAIAEREKANLPPISPAEYITYERQGAQLMRAAGLPKGFYDNPDDFHSYLSGDVSLAELSQRIELGRDAAYNAPTEVRTALQQMYGLSDGDLTAYFLDPTRAEPLLKQQYTAAQIGGASTRAGFGMSSVTEAEQLAKQGITEDQASQGFGQLAQSQELFGQLPGEAGGAIGRQEQIDATFSNNAAARARIEAKKAKRAAEFGGGGGVYDSQQGAIGLGDQSRR